MFDKKLKMHSQILCHIADGIYFVGSNRKILYWNQGAAAITGFSPEEMIGRNCYTDILGHEDEKGNVLCDLGCPLTVGMESGHLRRNLFLRTKDGRKILVEENISALYQAGKLAGVVIAFREVSAFMGLRPFQLRSEKLKRLIPICGWCKKIRQDGGAWEQLEVFLSNEGFGDFTHSMCPICAEKIFTKKIYLENYQNICKAISTSLSLGEVLKLIVTNVVRVMNVKASLLRLLNRETNQLEIASYHGLSPAYVNKGPVEYDASIDDALSGKPVSIYDITADRNARYRKDAEREGIRSILSIPLRFKDEVIGVLRMYTGEPVEYSDEDLNFVAAIAEQAAIAIVNARMFEQSVSKEREYLNVFQTVTDAVSGTLNVGEVLDLIVRKIPEVLHLKGATIRLLNETGTELKLVAAHGLSEKYLNKGPVDTEENVRTALNENPVAISDAATDPRIRYKKEAEEEGIKSMLTLPIIARGKVIGVLRLLTGYPRNFSPEEIDFAASLAKQCGTAIENARLYEGQHREIEYLKTIQEVSRAISSTLNVREVLDMIVKKIPLIMNTKAATIRLLDDSGNKLQLVASFGLSERYLSRGPVDAEENISVALEGSPLAIYDATTDPRISYRDAAKEEGIKSMLVVPIVVQGRIIGIMRLLTGEFRLFRQEEIEFAIALAEQGGIAIENAKMYEKIRTAGRL
ncbi:Putative phytochrome sensor protein (modular protein) [Candidatus Sulfobium mesophilum]|uniref:Phytochrome sensor protein (Modular protein) n=1 Tax=Candidatus Sulfobium mesophilum TaxID=2016548 RepID=A0A2U3QGV5_9BACT|nr:Putative phytochrome sensor protein (modular protein) [Candidatus Sulfobium mesophilum]